MIVTAKQHADALARIASLEKKICDLRTHLDKLAYAAGFVYLPERKTARYAHKDSDEVKEFVSGVSSSRAAIQNQETVADSLDKTLRDIGWGK